MIAYLGMSEKLPNLCYYSNDEYSFNRPYSEKTAELIDEEVKNMVNEQYERAKKILSEHRDGHAKLSQLLIDKEVIFAEDVEEIFGKRPWASRSEEISANKISEEREAQGRFPKISSTSSAKITSLSISNCDSLACPSLCSESIFFARSYCSFTIFFTSNFSRTSSSSFAVTDFADDILVIM